MLSLDENNREAAEAGEYLRQTALTCELAKERQAQARVARCQRVEAIAARVADDCFAWLDAPVKRVASMDTWVGYAPSLEDEILPQVADFTKAYTEIARY